MTSAPGVPWYRGLTGRQWTVLAVAWMGWVFDIMDVFLLVHAREKLFTELAPESVGMMSSLAFSVTLAGWAIGGIVFGMVADRWGRTRTMALTILMYSVFTGLAGFSGSAWQFIALRFLAALGIGGEWGAGAAMIAEVFPARARAVGCGLLQAASAVGFFVGTFVWFLVGENWRYAFFAGAAPALLSLVVRLLIREPEAWIAARERARSSLAERMGSLRSLFADPELRRRAQLGAGIAVLGICAYWSTTFWFPDSLKPLLKEAGLAGDEARRAYLRSSLLLHLSSLIGFLLYIPITERFGRVRTSILFHAGSVLFVPAAFLLPNDLTTWRLLWCPMQVFVSGVFSSYTIHFPEMFPTRLRATGASFCYNAGRIVAAPLGFLKEGLFLPLFGSGLMAAAAMGGLYGLALLLIPFLPETRGSALDVEGAPADPART